MRNVGFIITGVSKELLENKVKPTVEAFLSERGLSLSPEKTKITHINEGLDFLGMNVRKYNNDKLIIKPAKSSVKRFLADIRGVIKQNATIKTENLIYQLNPKIQGWSNYYRHVCANKTFKYVGAQIFKAVWRWAVRRHPNKNMKWVQRKYFRKHKYRNWVFSTKVKDKEGKTFYLDLVEARNTPIRRHIKIKGEAIPYDAAYHEYLNKRTRKEYDWSVCWWNFLKPKRRTEKTELPTAA